MMKASLSPSMIAALRGSANGDYSIALSYEVPSENLHTTFGGNRNSFKALEKRGLVRKVFQRKSHATEYVYAWQITDQGQQILNEIDGGQS